MKRGKHKVETTMLIARITKPAGSTGRCSRSMPDVHRFVTLLNARRVLRDSEPERHRVSLNQLLRGVNLTWHGVKLNQPDWSERSHSIAFTVEIREQRLLFHVILNAYWQPLDFELPRLDRAGENPWRRWIDTALDSPHDIDEWETAEPVPDGAYRAEPRSVVMLFTVVDVVRIPKA